MATMQKERLRPLTIAEQRELRTIVKASSERVDRVQRATALLAVAGGESFSAVAGAVGYQSPQAVTYLVRRFNRVGLAALRIAAGRGRRPTYDAAARARIVATAQRPPDRKVDGTATWSLSTLERTLRREGLPRVGATTIRRVLHDAGSSYQRTRTWCPTGTAQRKRKAGVVRVVDPKTEEKRGPSSGPTAPPKPPACRSGARTRPGRIRRSPSPGQAGRRSVSRPGSPTSTSGAGRPSC
jgi:transposase